MGPGTAIGRYQVKRKLAEGGMAEIFLAAATGPEGFEKEVVIKRIRSFLAKDQTFIEMFKAEARLASRLNHANIVQIFDFAMHEDTYFIAMEFVHGGSLWDLRRRCRELGIPFPPSLVAEIGSQVARGLHYAHGLTDKGKLVGLVHRDVTPHNVLLGFDGAVKLTDFGIAKAGTSFTAPGMLKGKFAYMSPEQGRGEPVDSRTDVFALGVVLWEMLTGGRLFEGESDVAVLRAVQVSEIAPPTRLNPEVPEQLSQVVMKALARPVEQRHQTAQEFERALAGVALQHAKTVEDVNVGAFVRLIYKDELEAEHEEQLKQGTQSVTPMPVEVSLGGTMFKDRSGEHSARSGEAPAEPLAEKPRTDVMPGMRSSRKLPTVESDDSSAARTDTMDSELRKPKTELQPKRPSSKKLVTSFTDEPTFTPAKPPVQQTGTAQDSGATPSITDRNPDHLLEPSEQPTARPGSYRVLSGETPTARAGDYSVVAPRRSLLPWVVCGLLALGVVGGVFGSSMFANHSSPGVSTVQDVTPPLPPPVKVVEAVKPAEETKPVEPLKVVELPAPEVEPEKKTEAKSAPLGFGVLLVRAVPFAEVFVDGRLSGEVQGATGRFRLPAGPHKVKLHHPKRDAEQTVMIKVGAEQLVEFNALSHE